MLQINTSAIAAALCALLALAAPPATASDYQENWSPNTYRFKCSMLGCEYDESTHRLAESLMPHVIDGMRGLKFDAPFWFGKRVGAGTPEDHVELYETDADTIARATPRCLPAGFENSFIEIGSQFNQFDDRDYLIYYFMAHEFFHIIQNEHPWLDPETCANLPGWAKEGTATAVGQALTRKRYPGVFPEKRDERVARNFAGLRRYDKPFTEPQFKDGKEVRTGVEIDYRTSSFWSHLAEVYHQGRYDFLKGYMDLAPAGDDWDSWLRNNVESSTGVDLSMVFGGFLGDYAGWGDPGYPGEYFGRRKWLYSTLTGCETLFLNKAEPADYVELELRPLTGKCVEVAVSALGPDGIAEGESAAVQIAGIVMSGPPSARGGIQLALAASNDKRKFHCAREVKRSRKAGLARCLWVPDDGRIRIEGGSMDARVWNVFAQERGKAEGEAGPAEIRQEPGNRKGELNNLYTVSYTPTRISMRDSRFSNNDPITVRLYFVLDVAKVEVEGQAKKGAVGTVGSEPADSQTTLPKQDKAGNRVNSFAKPDRFQSPIAIPAQVTPEAEGRMSYLQVGTTADNADSRIGLVLAPGRENAQGRLDPYPLSVGESGTFPVLISADIESEPATSLKDAVLVVEEFTDISLRARFSGTLCRHRDIIPSRPGQPAENPCRDPFPVSGRVVKAFPGSRLPGRYMVVERTEGTEMFRKAAEQGMSEWADGTPAGSEERPGVPPPGDSTGGGGMLEDCACTCEERAETERVGMEMKRRMEAGEDVAPGALMGLMRCTTPCRAEYAVCAMQEDRAREAREEEAAARARQALKESDACDCSCEGIQAMQGRTESILQAMQDGSPLAMGDLQQLGECMSACESELSRCAGRP